MDRDGQEEKQGSLDNLVQQEEGSIRKYAHCCDLSTLACSHKRGYGETAEMPRSNPNAQRRLRPPAYAEGGISVGTRFLGRSQLTQVSGSWSSSVYSQTVTLPWPRRSVPEIRTTCVPSGNAASGEGGDWRRWRDSSDARGHTDRDGLLTTQVERWGRDSSVWIAGRESGAAVGAQH
jgi:hypothetical protein